MLATFPSVYPSSQSRIRYPREQALHKSRPVLVVFDSGAVGRIAYRKSEPGSRGA